jgi:hypothetical protein
MWACLCFCGASVSPLICRDSAVRRNADSCACATFTSPAYMNSTNARRWWNATSRKNKIGCLHGLLCKEFSNNDDLTEWCTVTLEEVRVIQVFKKCVTINRNQKFSTMFAQASHQILSWGKKITPYFWNIILPCISGIPTEFSHKSS